MNPPRPVMIWSWPAALGALLFTGLFLGAFIVATAPVAAILVAEPVKKAQPVPISVVLPKPKIAPVASREPPLVSASAEATAALPGTPSSVSTSPSPARPQRRTGKTVRTEVPASFSGVVLPASGPVTSWSQRVGSEISAAAASGQGGGGGGTRELPSDGSLEELDAPLHWLRQPPPVYPRGLGHQPRISVAAEYTLEPDGSISQVRFLEPRAPALFEEAVRNAVLQWRSEPPLIRGKATRIRLHQRLDFEAR